jgi:molybdate transport system ATP-binding protein
VLSFDAKKHLSDGRQSDFVLDVKFDVGDGFTVLTGASGAGKTTILRLIAGIISPDEGRITLGDQTFFDSNAKIDLPIQRRRVGFVFQDYALFPHLSAVQNVAYGVKSSDKRERADTALRMLSLFHIEHLGRRLPREMSGGQQQRVALARALASDPAIVLLDEPLSAVDVETRLKLLDEIENAQHRANIPFIYVTHNKDEAERLAEYRIVIENGRLPDTTRSEC